MTQPTPAEARQRAYDSLYAELTRGVAHAQVRHHLIEEYRAAVLNEAAHRVHGAASNPTYIPSYGEDPNVLAVARDLLRMAVEDGTR